VQVGVNFLYFFDVWAGDPTQTLAWSAFVWQLDERLTVDFSKGGDVDWENQNPFELDCSFLSVSSRKLAFDSPSLKHGHDS